MNKRGFYNHFNFCNVCIEVRYLEGLATVLVVLLSESVYVCVVEHLFSHSVGYSCMGACRSTSRSPLCSFYSFVPVSPVVHFDVFKNHFLFVDWRYLNITFLF